MVYVKCLQVLQRGITFNVRLNVNTMESKRRYFLNNLGLSIWFLKELEQIKSTALKVNVNIFWIWQVI